MNTHEDSIPFRFTPDGLDETAIDELIAQSYGESGADDVSPPVDLAERRRVRHGVPHSPSPFGDEAA